MIEESYGTHDQQTLTITSSSSVNWVAYIHGGAWRDPFMTKTMGYSLLSHVPETWSGLSIDYRLSPAIQHPAHIDDVMTALAYVVKKYKVEKVILVGHSAGACLALQALARYSTDPPSFEISAIVGVEGIYDFAGLVEEYPDYLSFINPAFGGQSLWAAASPAAFDWSSLSLPYSPKIKIVQSVQDELLTMAQADSICQSLQSWNPDLIKIEGGSHNETVDSIALRDIINSLCT
ncbi:Alpha/Beta hydrolase protein [Lipomyces arxii]|uniref:Alpha/Beta hydrolase protein n=1 Tax=Lipomyces arxii TaxID=56418 RepID=UPI0034CFB0FB